MAQSKAVLCGITGLIGSSLPPHLSKSFSEITAPVRRPHSSNHELLRISECNYENLQSYPEVFSGAQSLFYCLGTTRNNAGSSAKFREIEWRLATQFLTAAQFFHIPQVVLLSAKGADPLSLFPYFKVKGDIERLAQSMNFRSLIVARPSLLMGERSESRFLEGISAKAAKPILPQLQKYMASQAPIEDHQLAAALVKASQHFNKGVHILENKDLIRQVF